MNHHSSTLRSNTSSIGAHQWRRTRADGGRGSSSAGQSSGKATRGDRKCIRLLSVCLYIFFVSSPAVLLSYYYTRVWDPKYVNKESMKTSTPRTFSPGGKNRRDVWGSLNQSMDEEYFTSFARKTTPGLVDLIAGRGLPND